VALFVNEVVNKTIREESHAEELCDFLIQSLVALDQPAVQAENFHLIFLTKLSRYLGFGVYHPQEVLGGRITSPEMETALVKLLSLEYAQPFSWSLAQRRELLELMLQFYARHLDTLGEMKSLQVLREVMS
jgi:DNA repair protein RecO (recombination protein O)